MITYSRALSGFTAVRTFSMSLQACPSMIDILIYYYLMAALQKRVLLVSAPDCFVICTLGPKYYIALPAIRGVFTRRLIAILLVGYV